MVALCQSIVARSQRNFWKANCLVMYVALLRAPEMSAKLQVKLLRVLQERQFEPVGSDSPVQVDVRVVAATNRDLRVAVRERRFREDLFYRLNVLPLELPPLRERDADLVLLIRHFLTLHARRKGKTAIQVNEDAMAIMKRYSWPGNVREVENL